MQISFILILLVVLLVPDIYIWFHFIRMFGPLWSVLWFLPSIIALGSILLGISGNYHVTILRVFFTIVLCFALPKIIFTLISVIGMGVSLAVSQAFFIGNCVALILALLVFGSAIYGLTAGWKRLVISEKTMSFSTLPKSFDGYRIVHLSDLHIGTYLWAPDKVDRLVEKVNAQNADAVLFTGDLVNASAEEVEPFMEVLRKMRAKDGVFSVMGNHDYCEYARHKTPDGGREDIEKLQRLEREIGWELLLNEHRTIRRGADSIAIVGVENDSNPPFPQYGDLPKALDSLEDDAFKILMSHDPTHWRRAILPTTNVQLTLSGHTHAMQLKLFGHSPASIAYPEWGGVYTEGKRILHVSVGAGSNMPFRLGAWPEVTVITLKAE